MAFALDSLWRGTSQVLSNAKCSCLSPARSKACSGEKRNKWQGPASGGEDAVYVGFDLEQALRSAKQAPIRLTTYPQRIAKSLRILSRAKLFRLLSLSRKIKKPLE